MLLSSKFEVNRFNQSVHQATPLSAKFKFSRNLVSMLGDGFIVLDFLCLALVLTFMNADELASGYAAKLLLGLPAAMLAPLIFYHKRLGAAMRSDSLIKMMYSHLLRFGLFTVAVLLVVKLGPTLDTLSQRWLAGWLMAGLLVTTLSRILAFAIIRYLRDCGSLRETIALVGVGATADHLVDRLSQAQVNLFELLGVFDDKVIGASPGKLQSSGNLAQLIELGKSHDIDWILLTLPVMPTERLQSIVGRLKALSAPIGVCTQQAGANSPYHVIDKVGDAISVGVLADRTGSRSDRLLANAENIVPRWIVTTVLLPLTILADKLLAAMPTHLSKKSVSRAYVSKTKLRQTFQFDNYDIDSFTAVASSFGQQHYGYVVTPNVDHMIRLHDQALFRALYKEASYILLDSRFFSHLLRLRRGLALPVCTGSDLTACLFAKVITPTDRIVMVGGSVLQAEKVRDRYGLVNLAHYNPPMGFIKNPQAVESCLQFIEANSPFRFCFLAVGAPQQEMVAQQLKTRGLAHGLALCIGASINFITGDEQRAPLWMQRAGIEWLYRLIQAPQRMANRYLVNGPRIFSLLQHTDIVLRDATLENVTGNPKRTAAKISTQQPDTMSAQVDTVQACEESARLLKSEQAQLASVATLLASVAASKNKPTTAEPIRQTRGQVERSY